MCKIIYLLVVPIGMKMHVKIKRQSFCEKESVELEKRVKVLERMLKCEYFIDDEEIKKLENDYNLVKVALYKNYLNKFQLDKNCDYSKENLQIVIFSNAPQYFFYLEETKYDSIISSIVGSLLKVVKEEYPDELNNTIYSTYKIRTKTNQYEKIHSFDVFLKLK